MLVRKWFWPFLWVLLIPVVSVPLSVFFQSRITLHEGTTYYFCAIACKERFDAEPAKFLGAAEKAAAEAPVQPSAAPEPSRKELASPAPEPRKWWQFWRS